MNPDQAQPQQENPSLKKLEEDLQSLSQEAASASPGVSEPPAPPSQETPQQVSAPNTPSEFHPVPPKKSSPIVVVAIIMAVAALIVAAAYLVGSQLFNKEKTACTLEAKICPDGSSVGRTGPKCEFAECPVASPTPDPIANWETYTNNEWGISLKHPSDWQVSFDSKNENGENNKNLKIMDSKNTHVLNFDSSMAGYGGVICKFNDSTSKEFAGPGTDQLYDYKELGIFLNKSVRRNLFPISDPKQYGYQRNQIEYTFRVCTKIDGLNKDGKYAYTGMFDTNKGILEVTYTTPVNGVVDDNLVILDQILSTFKFLEATSSASPTALPKGTSTPTSSPSATPVY